MTAHERGQWLLLLHAYLMAQHDRAPTDFADRYTLALVNELLWQAYQDMANELGMDIDMSDGLKSWLLALWPTPPMA